MDFQDLPSNLKKPLIISSSTALSQTIPVPKGASFVFAVLRAKGGNGGNGFTRTAGSAGGGGGGGGPGAADSVLFPASLFNGSLVIDITSAGVLALQNSRRLTLSSVSNGSNGSNGTGAAAGALGGPGAVTTTGIYAIESGLRTLQVATAGGAQTGAAGVSITATALNTHTGGMGGGGCTTTNFAGGGLTFVALGGLLVTGGTAAGGKGNSGFFLHDVNYGVGGGGGGSNNSGVGGAGGDGVGYGCGGGGGGAGTTGGVGGIGGPAAAFLYFF